MYLSITLAVGVTGDHWTKDQRSAGSLPRGSQLVEREAMVAEENAQHHQRRHEIPAENGPRLERVEQPRAEDHHRREDRDLEATEEGEEAEQQVPVTLGDGEEAGDGQAEDDEGESVDRGVLEDDPGRDREGGRISEAVEEDRAEQRRGPERASSDQIQDEEPDRDRPLRPARPGFPREALSVDSWLSPRNTSP